MIRDLSLIFFQSLKSRRYIVFPLIGVILTGIAYGTLTASGFLQYDEYLPSNTDGSGQISTLVVEDREVAENIQVSGQIVFREKVNISAKVRGRLSRIYVREGQHVNKGELIAEIERMPLEISLQQQKSELDIAVKALELADARYRDALKGVEIKLKSIRKAGADLNDKRVSYENMNKILGNREILFEAGGVSRTELDNIKTEHTTLYTRYKVAEADYEIQQVGYRDQDITAEGFELPETEEERISLLKHINTKIERAELESAESRVKQAENNLKSTKIMLEETYIRSPIRGIAATRNMEAGEMIKEDSIITTIIDISDVYFSMNINESMLNRVSPGQTVFFSADALGSSYDFTGQIETISPVLDTKTRTAEVKAIAGNPDGNLLPGMFVRGIIKTGRKEKGVLIPESAVLNRDDGRSEVYIVKNNIVFRENVVTGNRHNDLVRITEGLSAGDVIITSGLNHIYQGMRVD